MNKTLGSLLLLFVIHTASAQPLTVWGNLNVSGNAFVTNTLLATTVEAGATLDAEMVRGRSWPYRMLSYYSPPGSEFPTLIIGEDSCWSEMEFQVGLYPTLKLFPDGLWFPFSQTNEARVLVKAGTSVTYANAGGTLASSTTTAGNTGSSETDLFATTVKANTLASNGDAIRYTVAGTFAANANNKRIRVRLGSAVIFDSNSQAVNSGEWSLNGLIIRTGATSQKCTASLSTSNTSFPSHSDYATSSETLSQDLTLKVTAQATSNSDITGELWRSNWEPAP
jgi:hypothetical protein